MRLPRDASRKKTTRLILKRKQVTSEGDLFTMTTAAAETETLSSYPEGGSKERQGKGAWELETLLLTYALWTAQAAMLPVWLIPVWMSVIYVK